MVNSTNRNRFRSWILRVLGVGIAVIFLIAILSHQFGRGSLGYFSPDTFATRYQHEYCLPPFAIPIYRSGYVEGEPYPLVKYLVDKGYWSPNQKANPQWIGMYHWNAQWLDGESSLYRALSMSTESWKDWTDSNPELAAVMWPKLLTILRTEYEQSEMVYLVLWSAQQCTTIEELDELVMNDPELKSAGITAIWRRDSKPSENE